MTSTKERMIGTWRLIATVIEDLSTGEKTNAAGDVRDGGSFEQRFSNVAVWNNLPDEAEFLYAKWNEFNAA